MSKIPTPERMAELERLVARSTAQITGAEVCDDCGQAYPGPAYYSVGEGCELWEETPDGATRLEHECTGNICPDCAGPFLEPDLENDPRRPPIDFYDERLHRNMMGGDA